MGKQANVRTGIVVLVFVSFIWCGSAAGTVIYVDSDAPGPVHDGNDWGTAYRHLQDALADPWPAPGDEIWVAEGIYTPDTNSAEPNGSGDRSASFELVGEVTLKGGYAGYGEANPDLRRHDVFRSILSGDLDGNDVEINDPCDLLYEPTRADNSFHVVRVTEADDVVVDGFTIRGGNANGVSADSNGGGIYSVDSNVTVTKCYFWRCSASSDGGAVWSGWSAPFSMTHSSGSENSASRGGALCNFAGTSRVTNCIFNGNDANDGGAVVTLGGTVNVTNSTFSENSAQGMGGGICNLNVGTVTITNSIMWSDTAPYGNEIALGNSATVDVNYSVVQDGNAGIYNDGSSFVSWGGGNEDADPCFVDSGSPERDFHLRSRYGTWNSNEGSWDTYGQDSPAIDMGEGSYPLGQETFANGGRINAGAYGGTSEASRTANPSGACEKWIAGDINGDCIINFHDLAFICDNWLEDNTY